MASSFVFYSKQHGLYDITLDLVILDMKILLSEPCTVIFRMCSALSCCFAMCFKCFGVLFFSVRLISSVVLHVRLTCVY